MKRFIYLFRKKKKKEKRISRKAEESEVGMQLQLALFIRIPYQFDQAFTKRSTFVWTSLIEAGFLKKRGEGKRHAIRKNLSFFLIKKKVGIGK